jgi:hypothetical protein
MIPATIKRLFHTSVLGVVLCLTALFLIGNTLYLNQIKESKQTNLETITQQMEALHEGMVSSRQRGQWNLPQLVFKPPHYGAIVKPMLPIFQESTKGEKSKIFITRVEALEKTEKVPQSEDLVNFSSSNKRRKSQGTRTFQEIKLYGTVEGFKHAGAYRQLNHVIAQIKVETGCALTLDKAFYSELKQENSGIEEQPMHFELSLRSDLQPACFKPRAYK